MSTWGFIIFLILWWSPDYPPSQILANSCDIRHIICIQFPRHKSLRWQCTTELKTPWLISRIFGYTWWYVDKIKFETEGWGDVGGGDQDRSFLTGEWRATSRRDGARARGFRQVLGLTQGQEIVASVGMGLICGFRPRQAPGQGQELGQSGWLRGRRVVFTCSRYFLWELIRLREGKCSVPGECRGARKMTPYTTIPNPHSVSSTPTHTHTQTCQHSNSHWPAFLAHGCYREQACHLKDYTRFTVVLTHMLCQVMTTFSQF